MTVAREIHTMVIAKDCTWRTPRRRSDMSAGQGDVDDENYTVTFDFYSSATGSTPLWSETQAVATTDGLFSTQMGGIEGIGILAGPGVRPGRRIRSARTNANRPDPLPSERPAVAAGRRRDDNSGGDRGLGGKA